MNRSTVILLAAFLFFMLPVMASAEPTINGPSGLFIAPTADIAPTDHAWISLNFLDLDTIIMPDQSVEGGTVWTGLLTGGLADNFEVGLGFNLQEESSNGVLFNAKFLVLEADVEEWYPAVAVGGMLSQFSGENNTTFYATASKFFWVTEEGYYGGSAHFGIDWAEVADNWELEFFAAADLSFTEDIMGIVEWHEDNEMFGDGWTYGVRYYFSDTTTGQAGFIGGDLTIGGAYIF
jgi:hypothetical protein